MVKQKKVNGVLNQYLKNYVNANTRDWGEHLDLVEFCYNSIMHSTTKMSPFELTLGKETRKPMNGLSHSHGMKGLIQGSCGDDQGV
jgi:hypothetical protein